MQLLSLVDSDASVAVDSDVSGFSAESEIAVFVEIVVVVIHCDLAVAVEHVAVTIARRIDIREVAVILEFLYDDLLRRAVDRRIDLETSCIYHALGIFVRHFALFHQIVYDGFDQVFMEI